MAIDFYKLGRQSGATTPKGQQSGFESLVSSATKPLEDMIKASKVATAALSAAMPAGVPIDKIPEQLRGKVSKYLADNKKEYTDAAKVVTSGINPNSKRYRDAIETMNRVGAKFENLSNTLEDIAVKRKSALDDPSFSPATLGIDKLTFENLQNGNLYSSMTLNEDGTFNYIDGEGASKAWSDFAIAKQGFTGQQTYVGALEKLREYKKTTPNASWGQMQDEMQITFDSLFQQLGPKGAADYAFADDAFITEMFPIADTEDGKDVLRKNPTEVVDEYKLHVMKQLEKEFEKMDEYDAGWQGTAAEWDSHVEINRLTREMKKVNKEHSDFLFVSKNEIQRTDKKRLQFIKNEMGIPLTAQIFLAVDEQTGGYSYYIKKEMYDSNNNVTIGEQKIQDAYRPKTDGGFEPVELEFNNFRFILESYKII